MRNRWRMWVTSHVMSCSPRSLHLIQLCVWCVNCRPSSAPPAASVSPQPVHQSTAAAAPVSRPPTQPIAPRPSGPPSPGTLEAIARDLEEPETDDTMNNLRKTFAGIFGNMSSWRRDTPSAVGWNSIFSVHGPFQIPTPPSTWETRRIYCYHGSTTCTCDVACL